MIAVSDYFGSGLCSVTNDELTALTHNLSFSLFIIALLKLWQSTFWNLEKADADSRRGTPLVAEDPNNNN